jgi:uncharacterized glyoxalase superfamily protein PhnB
MNTQNHQPNTLTNRSMPPGTIIPELAYGDVATAADWLCTTSGFQPRLRIGNHRFQLVFGDSAIVVIGHRDGSSFRLPEDAATHSIMVQVSDVDQHYTHALQAGARIINPPTDHPFGERQYTAEDLIGRRWTFSQSIADVAPQKWGGVLFEGE